MNTSNRFYLIFRCSLLLVLGWQISTAQHYRIPLGMRGQDILEKWDLAYGAGEQFHNSIKPYTGWDAFRIAQHLDTTIIGKSASLSEQISYILRDNNEWFLWQSDDPEAFFLSDERIQKSRKPFLRSFYRSPAHFYELYKKDFFLQLDPILQFDVLPSLEDDGMYFNNLRGLTIRGGLDRKLYFYSNILEEQSRFPNYIRSWITKFRTVPGAGFYKEHNSRIFDEQNGHDYLRAQGHLGFQASRHFGIELGHGNHLIGNGIRSFFLSEFAGNYFYLKFNTRVWKFQYQNIFAELSPIGARDDEGDALLPKKYFAAHYLHFNLSENFTVGLFESVVFSRQNQFEFQYLNPVILYRTVEQAIGSPDNVILGLDASWNVGGKISLYGQFLLDEFKFDEIFGGNQWWGNKFAMQGGIKWPDAAGISDLDIQVEVNLARPYTYAHRDSLANYSHYNQALAHPLGANFREVILKARYRPLKNVEIAWSGYLMKYGEDPEGFNYGKNILLPNESRVGDTGIELGQGIDTRVFHSDFHASYEVRHNFFVDFIFVYRKTDSDDPALDMDTNYAGLGIRANIARRLNVF